MSNVALDVADFQVPWERCLESFTVLLVSQFQHLREFFGIERFLLVMDQDIQGLSVTDLPEEDAVTINLKVSKIDIFSDVFEFIKSYPFIAQMQINI